MYTVLPCLPKFLTLFPCFDNANVPEVFAVRTFSVVLCISIPQNGRYFLYSLRRPDTRIRMFKLVNGVDEWPVWFLAVGYIRTRLTTYQHRHFQHTNSTRTTENVVQRMVSMYTAVLKDATT
jgi:hypothetical protein